MFEFFDPYAPVDRRQASLPHWRQGAVTYFVTFRLADSLPASLLDAWSKEREAWVLANPRPWSPKQASEYGSRFNARVQRWLDRGVGSCILALSECRLIVEGALRHFAHERYELDELVVAPNHVHAIVTPRGEHALSSILHSWKSFTAKKILAIDCVARTSIGADRVVWQRESFDHIVRNDEQLEKIRDYIRDHE